MKISQIQRHLPTALTTAFFLVLAIHPQTVRAGSKPLREAIQSGQILTIKESTPMNFGDAGAWYFQGGKRVSEKELKGDPHCKVTSSSNFESRLNHAPFAQGQEVILSSVEVKSFSILGWNKFSLKIEGLSSIQNSSANKPGVPATEQMLMQLNPGTLKLLIDCPNFKQEPTIDELKKTLGEELFIINDSVGPADLLRTVRTSEAFKAALAKQEEAKRRKAEEEKRRLDEEAASIGPESPNETPVSAISVGDGVRIKSSDMKTLLPILYALGSVFQNGDRVGTVDRQIGLSALKDKELDSQKPLCSVIPADYRSRPLSVTVPIPMGTYEITESKAHRSEDSRQFTIKAKSPTTGEGIITAMVFCQNVKSVGDIRHALGESVVFLEKDAEAKAALRKAAEAAAAAANPSASNAASTAQANPSVTDRKDITDPTPGSLGPATPPSTESGSRAEAAK